MKNHVKNMALMMAAVMMLALCSCDGISSSKQSSASDEVDVLNGEGSGNVEKVSGTKPVAADPSVDLPGNSVSGNGQTDVLPDVLVFGDTGPDYEQMNLLFHAVIGLERNEAVELLEKCFGAELKETSAVKVSDHVSYSYSTSIVIHGCIFDTINMECTEIADLDTVYGVSFNSANALSSEMHERYVECRSGYNSIFGEPEFQLNYSKDNGYDNAQYNIGKFTEFDLWCYYYDYNDPQDASICIEYSEAYY